MLEPLALDRFRDDDERRAVSVCAYGEDGLDCFSESGFVGENSAGNDITFTSEHPFGAGVLVGCDETTGEHDRCCDSRAINLRANQMVASNLARGLYQLLIYDLPGGVGAIEQCANPGNGITPRANRPVRANMTQGGATSNFRRF